MRRIVAVPIAWIAMAAALPGCVGDGDSAPNAGLLRTLSGQEVRQLLGGNTLVGRDGAGPFWMHYPSEDTVWGLASSGDVDIGHWWVSGNHYCRSWRHWSNGREQCWLFATDGSDELLWIEPDGRSSGKSTIQAGNTIGRLTRSQTAAALIGSDSLADDGAPYGEEVPVDASGTVLLARYVGNRADDGPGGIDAGPGSGGGSSAGGGNASGGSGSGGSSSSGGGASSGSSAGGSGGSSGNSSGGNGSPGGSGSSGDDDDRNRDDDDRDRDDDDRDRDDDDRDRNDGDDGDRGGEEGDGGDD
jgi:hypothetical protein